MGAAKALFRGGNVCNVGCCKVVVELCQIGGGMRVCGVCAGLLRNGRGFVVGLVWMLCGIDVGLLWGLLWDCGGGVAGLWWA